jgi:hypothetical protein
MKFRLALLAVVALSVAVASGLVGAAGVASATPFPGTYTCRGGDLASGDFTSIPSGTYATITVAGVCNVQPNAAIKVIGNLTVMPGAVFDAQSAPSTITVGRNLVAGPGSFLGLGCQPTNTIGMFAGVPCADPYAAGHTTITVKGNISAGDADTVLIRHVTVGGYVNLNGGGGDIPWSIKGNAIAGNLTVNNVAADWVGVQFNHVGGNAILTRVTSLDPGDPGRTVAVVENTVAGNLGCSALVPGVSGGFIPGEVNHVGGDAAGQCAAISVKL